MVCSRREEEPYVQRSRHARGTGSGSPQDLSKGEQAEKGDARRPFRQHQGKTRHSTRQDVPPSDDTADATDGDEQDDAQG